MRMVDIIEKKRDRHANTQAEIRFAIQGYVEGKIPDYQMSAWLMAIYFVGMNDEEAYYLTDSMLHSGEVIDLSSIQGVKVDKHSTGGVGDKTTLVLGPIAAAAGTIVAKLSGRGLGHTGGTLDKLESIEGCRIDLSQEAFLKQVKDINIAIAGQTQEIVPADKLMYALRDVSGSVPSIPLIASSIMSKKLASGADVICLDVKIGDGAFMKTMEDARILSKLMVSIGKQAGKRVIAFITDMNQPLGFAIGNRLEVKEAIDTLAGNGPEDLTTLCVEIGAQMIYQAQKTATIEEAKTLVLDLIYKGKALAKFHEFIRSQGGQIHDLDTFIQVKEVIPFVAQKEGYIHNIKAQSIGLASMKLGGGREVKTDIIDPMVGIVLHKKVGAYVKKGDVLLDIYANKSVSSEILDSLLDAFDIQPTKPMITPLIWEMIS
jgi:pyrimidine-nucleoside phosphorylase